MNAISVLRNQMKLSDLLVNTYVGDLTEAECLKRPAPAANHIIWQLGHLIVAESGLMGACAPGRLPPLPEGFADRYTKETAALDDASAFHTKQELLEQYTAQRQATDAILAELSEADLDQASPESYQPRFPTIGSLLSLVAIHPIMHCGQWVVVRRMLGKPVVI